MSSASPSSKNFPDRLRSARELRGLSQSDLAQRSGLQPSAVSHFETGRRAPSFDNLKRLADALEVTTDYLLSRSDEPKPISTAGGPTVDKLFRNAERLTTADLDAVAQMAELLAKKNPPPKKGD